MTPGQREGRADWQRKTVFRISLGLPAVRCSMFDVTHVTVFRETAQLDSDSMDRASEHVHKVDQSRTK